MSGASSETANTRPVGTAIYILAAGQSKRFGSYCKLEAQLRDKSVAQHVIDAACAAQVGPVFVLSDKNIAVCGAEKISVLGNQPLSARLHQVADHAQAHQCDALVLLGDMPLVRPETISKIAGTTGQFVRATSQNKPGFPVKIVFDALGALSKLEGDQGLSQILQLDDFVLVETLAEEGLDIDTVEDLAKIECQSASQP